LKGKSFDKKQLDEDVSKALNGIFPKNVTRFWEGNILLYFMFRNAT
jgi:hypothetical protein